MTVSTPTCSISDTWLRFPVGSGYAYSNLGIDLAGYILERVQDKPFAAVMRDSLLGPLGMERSTFDRTAIRSTSDRAVGHADPYPEPPVEVPMTAAGGLYSSVADLARFLAFQLNDGSIDGRMLLDPKSIEEQRTVPAPHPDAHPSPTRWRVHGSSATPSCPSSLQHLITWQENLSTAFSVRQPVCGRLADSLGERPLTCGNARSRAAW
jgi:CubicO group peptidase (beta-lactamase class C family)